MSIKPPFTDLAIAKSSSGFYAGYSVPIALISKISMAALILWALVWSESASSTLSALNSAILKSFNPFYVWVVAFFTIFLLAIAIIPATGRRKMGAAAPEFSNFSWFSMMFGAGLGVGLMVFATAEPLGLWASNPHIVSGAVEPTTHEALTGAWRYTFLHYGFQAWAIYVVTGLSLAYYAYTRDMPLTIRSALTPLFGKYMNGIFGHIVDVLGVVATILGVSVTIGFGVSQFVNGLFDITGMSWMMNAEAADPNTVGLLFALAIIMGLSIISAVSGVERGIRYLSNLNLVLSLILLLTFAVFGEFIFAISSYVSAFIDYIITFVPVTFEVFWYQSADDFAANIPTAVQTLPAGDVATIYGAATNPWGSESSFREALPSSFTSLSGAEGLISETYAAGADGRLFGWQAGWSTFYWAWWVAFSPFVGLFLARISKGRTVREFILGCMIAPALVCFAWMTILGGTAIELELSGVAQGAITGASNTDKLFVTLGQMLSGPALTLITIMCVVLILTFLVTSADSGILVMNTIMSGGSATAGTKHRIIWGLILTGVIGSLIIAAGGETGGGLGLSTLRSAMIIGALPFAFVMMLMCVSLGKALYRDNLRQKS